MKSWRALAVPLSSYLKLKDRFIMTASWDDAAERVRMTRCDGCERRFTESALRKRNGRWVCRSCAGQTVLFPRPRARRGGGFR